MKKKYEAPISEIVDIREQDIIRTSPDMPFVDGDDLFEDDLLDDGL